MSVGGRGGATGLGVCGGVGFVSAGGAGGGAKSGDARKVAPWRFIGDTCVGGVAVRGVGCLKGKGSVLMNPLSTRGMSIGYCARILVPGHLIGSLKRDAEP